MPLTPGVGERSFNAFMLRRLDPTARLIGTDVSWLAPVGIIQSAKGFDRSVWVDSNPESALCFRLDGAPITRHFVNGSTMNCSPNAHIAITPQGANNHFTCDGPILFAHVYLSTSLLDGVAHALDRPAPVSNRLPDLAFFEDDRLHQLVGAYINRARRVELDLPSRVEMEARALLIVERVLDIERYGYGVLPPPPPISKGGLARWQLRRVLDIMNSRLCEEIGLVSLAESIGLSPFHFARAFKISTGFPPIATSASCA